MVEIAPSILSADMAALGKEIQAIGPFCKYIHVDVMDGHFVPNITFGPPMVKSLRKVTQRILDVHLMMDEPGKYIRQFLEAGSDNITVHVEAVSVEDFALLATIVHEEGKSIGISLRPSTPLPELIPYLQHADLVLVMSVEPGFGGQSYIPESTDRIKDIKDAIKEYDRTILIEVDGGINDATKQEAIDAGADILVSGSYIFKSNDYGAAIRSLQ